MQNENFHKTIENCLSYLLCLLSKFYDSEQRFNQIFILFSRVFIEVKIMISKCAKNLDLTQKNIWIHSEILFNYDCKILRHNYCYWKLMKPNFFGFICIWSFDDAFNYLAAKFELYNVCKICGLMWVHLNRKKCSKNYWQFSSLTSVSFLWSISSDLLMSSTHKYCMRLMSNWNMERKGRMRFYFKILLKRFSLQKGE